MYNIVEKFIFWFIDKIFSINLVYCWFPKHFNFLLNWKFHTHISLQDSRVYFCSSWVCYTTCETTFMKNRQSMQKHFDKSKLSIAQHAFKINRVHELIQLTIISSYWVYYEMLYYLNAKSSMVLLKSSKDLSITRVSFFE